MQLSNKVVIKFLDGTIIRGVTNDFIPARENFHIIYRDNDTDKIKEVSVPLMKAVFFVRDFYGKKEGERHASAPKRLPENVGRRIKVTFPDGEVISGYTYSFRQDELGFFLFPMDEADNNQRIFVIIRNVAKIETEIQ